MEALTEVWRVGTVGCRRYCWLQYKLGLVFISLPPSSWAGRDTWMAQRLVATRSLLELSDKDATAVSCWHLVATVRDSWLVMAATLRECWRWHRGASVVGCRLLVPLRAGW